MNEIRISGGNSGVNVSLQRFNKMTKMCSFLHCLNARRHPVRIPCLCLFMFIAIMLSSISCSNN